MVRNALIGSIERNLEQMPTDQDVFVGSRFLGDECRVVIDRAEDESLVVLNYSERTPVFDTDSVNIKQLSPNRVNNGVTVKFLGGKLVSASGKNTKTISEGYFNTRPASTTFEGTPETLSILKLAKIAGNVRKARKMAEKAEKKLYRDLAKLEKS